MVRDYEQRAVRLQEELGRALQEKTSLAAERDALTRERQTLAEQRSSLEVRVQALQVLSIVSLAVCLSICSFPSPSRSLLFVNFWSLSRTSTNM